MEILELKKTDIATCLYLLQQAQSKEVGLTKRYVQLKKITSKFEKAWQKANNTIK